MRSVLGGDNENEMQGSDLDGCDVEQEGEEELRKKKKKNKEAWPVQSRQWGRHDLGWLKLGVRLWVELRLVRGLEPRVEVTFEIPSDRV